MRSVYATAGEKITNLRRFKEGRADAYFSGLKAFYSTLIRRNSTPDRCGRTHSSCCHFLIFCSVTMSQTVQAHGPVHRYSVNQKLLDQAKGFSSLHLCGSHPVKPSEECSNDCVQTESFSSLAHCCKCNKKGNGDLKLFNTNQIKIKLLYSCRQ